MSEFDKTLQSSRRNAHLNLYAASMCTICLAHCVLLPFIAVLLPVAGLATSDELVHKLLVLLSVPVSLWLVYRACLEAGNLYFIIVVLIGVTLLVVAAFVEALASMEVPITVAGALLLGFAHFQRWLRIRRGVD